MRRVCSSHSLENLILFNFKIFVDSNITSIYMTFFQQWIFTGILKANFTQQGTGDETDLAENFQGISEMYFAGYYLKNQ